MEWRGSSGLVFTLVSRSREERREALLRITGAHSHRTAFSLLGSALFINRGQGCTQLELCPLSRTLVSVGAFHCPWLAWAGTGAGSSGSATDTPVG